MWFRDIFRRPKGEQAAAPLFDEAFMRRLERLSLQAQRTLRGSPSSGEHLSRHQLPTTIFTDHRPYSPGDDYRYVDWNTYGHHEQVFVKLGEVEQDVNVHLLLDASRSMAWGSPPKLRTAQRLTAALGYLALTQSDRLRVVPFGAAPLRPFGPAQGKGRVIELLRFIEAEQPNQTTSISRALSTYAHQHERGGLLVICSDLLDPEGLADGLRSLPPPRWQVLVLHVLDRGEVQPELMGPIELEDSETGQRLALTLDEPTVAVYRRNFDAWKEQITDICGRRGATYAQILTDWPLEQQVVPYLRARRILR